MPLLLCWLVCALGLASPCPEVRCCFLMVGDDSPVSVMDTVLNLGLNETIVVALAKQKNERFAYDSYRRFIQVSLSLEIVRTLY